MVGISKRSYIFGWTLSLLMYDKVPTFFGSIRGRVAAGVPGRGKNWLINNDGNLYLATNDIVSSKSFSVSVGNPQITSVAIDIPSATLKRND